MAKPPSPKKPAAAPTPPVARSKGKQSNAAAAPWITQLEAQRLLGYSTTTLKNWRAQGCPGVHPVTGKCNLGLIAEWRADQREADVTKKYLGTDQEIMSEAEIDRQNALQDLYAKQIKNAEKLKLLIPREKVRGEMMRQFGKLQAEAQQIEATWAETIAMDGVVDGKGNVNAIAGILAEMREELFANLRADKVVDPVQRNERTGEEIEGAVSEDEEGD